MIIRNKNEKKTYTTNQKPFFIHVIIIFYFDEENVFL